MMYWCGAHMKTQGNAPGYGCLEYNTGNLCDQRGHCFLNLFQTRDNMSSLNSIAFTLARCGVSLYLQVRVNVVGISVRLLHVDLPFLGEHWLYRPVELVFVHHYTRVRSLLFDPHFSLAGDG